MLQMKSIERVRILNQCLGELFQVLSSVGVLAVDQYFFATWAVYDDAFDDIAVLSDSNLGISIAWFSLSDHNLAAFAFASISVASLQI